ncbi:MAG: hypothetical protein JSR37_02440 [Verrucomicrobia bacterium]|nr:hypothetical protein [Verrucomicrobiota bacterium]MBS0637934.1 hypothetical protein [Verrucomicrobiota bacterium]
MIPLQYTPPALYHLPVGAFTHCYEPVPKSIGYVVGERVIRPLFEYTASLLAQGFHAVQESALAIHRSVVAFSLFPVASAQLLEPAALSELACLPLREKSLELLEIVYGGLERKDPNNVAATALKTVISAKKSPALDCKKVLDDCSQAVAYVREHLEELVHDIEAGSFQQQNGLVDALLRLLHEATLYKKNKSQSESIFTFLWGSSLWGSSSDEPKLHQKSLYKALDSLISHKRYGRLLQSNDWIRSAAVSLAVGELKRFLEPATMDEGQSRLVKEELQRLIDEATQNLAWNPAIDFLGYLDSYVNEKISLQEFASKALNFIDVLLYVAEQGS